MGPGKQKQIDCFLHPSLSSPNELLGAFPHPTFQQTLNIQGLVEGYEHIQRFIGQF